MQLRHQAWEYRTGKWNHSISLIRIGADRVLIALVQEHAWQSSQALSQFVKLLKRLGTYQLAFLFFHGIKGVAAVLRHAADKTVCTAVFPDLTRRARGIDGHSNTMGVK